MMPESTILSRTKCNEDDGKPRASAISLGLFFPPQRKSYTAICWGSETATTPFSVMRTANSRR